MSALKIVLLSIGAAILYGILHDQVTARVCVEYFTIGHPPVFHTESPTLLAFGWGVIATWWMGLILGVPAASIARMGRRPRLVAADFLGPIGILLLTMGLSSAIAGFAGYWYGISNPALLAYFLRAIPPEKQAAFFADAWAHETAYGIGGLGGVIIWIWAWRRRTHLARASSPGSPAGWNARGDAEKGLP